MKEISAQDLEAYAKKKSGKLGDDAYKAISLAKSNKLLNKIIQAVEGVMRAIIVLENSLLKKFSADAKFDKQLIATLTKLSTKKEVRANEWVFTIERDTRGLIKKVNARSKK